jgi:hypothetical protein
MLLRCWFLNITTFSFLSADLGGGYRQQLRPYIFVSDISGIGVGGGGGGATGQWVAASSICFSIGGAMVVVALLYNRNGIVVTPLSIPPGTSWPPNSQLNRIQMQQTVRQQQLGGLK